MVGKKKKDRPRSGTMRITWAKCPNLSCSSREWAVWSVDFVEDAFECGTCQRKLLRPIFLCALEADPADCPLCKKKIG